jgi:hypothetical protein
MYAIRRPSLAGITTAAGGFCVVVLGLAILDERVRAEIMRIVSNRGPSTGLVEAGARMESFAMIVMHAIRYQSIEHAPLVIFALAALVLLLFMLRV